MHKFKSSTNNEVKFAFTPWKTTQAKKIKGKKKKILKKAVLGNTNLLSQIHSYGDAINFYFPNEQVTYQLLRLEIL